MVLDEATANEVREAQASFEQARERVWLQRIRVGLEYRRGLREIDEGVAEVRRQRDTRVCEAVAAGASYREVGRALGLSHSRIQQIVNQSAGPAALEHER